MILPTSGLFADDPHCGERRDQTVVVIFPDNFFISCDFKRMRPATFLASQKITNQQISVLQPLNAGNPGDTNPLIAQSFGNDETS